jgi:hypothetical protein
MSKRLGLPVSQATMVKRIIGYVNEAFLDNDAYEAGMSWYRHADDIARELAEEYDVSEEIAAYVIAATSPRTFWSFNVKHARAILAYEDAPSGAMGTNDARGRAVRDYGIGHIGNGPKVNAFARNIAGDWNEVTIDMWAFRAACGDLAIEKYLARKGAYETVAEAYRIAAKRFGIAPAQMQAIVWVAIRGRAD